MVKEFNANDINHSMLTGCINGNSFHQGKFYIKFNKLVFNTCLKYVKNTQEAEDITQNIFIKLFDNIHKFSGEDEKQLYSWVKMVSRNMTIDTIRKNKIKSVGISDDNIKDFSDDIYFDDIIDGELELQKDIKDAINKLSPKYKKVFELYYLDNYTHEEISKELNLNVGTSKSNLFKAKKKMALMLKKYNNKF